MAKWRAMVARSLEAAVRRHGLAAVELCIAAPRRYAACMIALRHMHVRSRWPWLVLLALCLIAKPMVELVGELHRDLHDVAHASANAALDTQDERSEHAPPHGWHAVMHIDQCCCTPALPDVAVIALASMPVAFVGSELALLVPPSPRRDVLRPPIAG